VVYTEPIASGNRTPLGKGVQEQIPDALAQVIKTILCLTQGDQSEAAEATPSKKQYRD
jgi:hypothetical protein